MVTKNPRINVTFAENIIGLLSDLAKKDNTSISSIVRDLTVEGLKLKEDIALSKIANEVDKISTQRIDHEDAWK